MNSKKKNGRTYKENVLILPRQVLGEEDEKQDNGKVFKKLTLGEYQWTTYNQVMIIEY